MKIKSLKNKAGGFVLVTVLILCAVSLIILVGIMNFTSATATMNMRNNQLLVCRNAAEAATERVYAKMAQDFQGYGVGLVQSNCAAGIYQAMVPGTNDNGYFANFVFSDSTNVGKTYVSFLTNYTGPMPTQYSNSFVTTSPIYRIASNVTMPGSSVSGVVGTAQEDVLLALVPITTYAIFYNGELEFSDCATMVINGRTHSNADICTGAGSGSTCTFNGAVTCCLNISSPSRGGLSYSLNQGTTFNAGSSISNNSVQISIPMTNTHSIIEIPPAGELPTSVIGQQREYNQASVVLVITNSPSGANPMVYLTLQAIYNGTVAGNDPNKLNYAFPNVTTTFLQTNSNTGTNIAMPFLDLTQTFSDDRENQNNMYVTQIDVGAYANWLSTNPVVQGKYTGGLYPTILYVADQRARGTSKLAVVRLKNAAQLPSNNGLGFSVATQNPLYIWGNYNTTQDGINYALTPNSTTNGWTVPAALISDALTILSSGWLDSNSSKTEPNRQAGGNLTMNAAVITGNIPTTGTSATTFSGGVHNLTRYLENWTGYTTTYNTSIVCLFSSQMAQQQFLMPYSGSNPNGYYNPPTRKWGFDPTFYNPGGQPPGVPQALIPIRFNWAVPPPGSVSSN